MIIRLGLRLARLGLTVLIITGLGVLVAEQLALSQFSPEALREVDALVVLGGGVDPDLEMNYVGRGRADAAAALLAEGKARAAILTGRLKDPGFPEGEAGLLRDRALAQGAPAAALILEPNARTTLENLILSFEIGRARGFERYAIVTDAFHLPRALVLAELLGQGNVTGVATDSVALGNPFGRLARYTREAMAWWYNLYKAAAWLVLDVMGVPRAEREAYVV